MSKPWSTKENETFKLHYNIEILFLSKPTEASHFNKFNLISFSHTQKNSIPLH